MKTLLDYATRARCGGDGENATAIGRYTRRQPNCRLSPPHGPLTQWSGSLTRARKVSMASHREDFWNLADLKDRFNQLQGPLRTLASTWTLAAFAGLAVLSQVAEKTIWLAPPAFLAWLISVLSAFGLALLWVMDRFVYQRLLDAAFVSGLLLERRHPDLPPVRSLMLAASSGGMSKYLKLFYFAPIAVFWALGLIVIIADLPVRFRL